MVIVPKNRYFRALQSFVHVALPAPAAALHRLRHQFASWMIEENIDIKSLQAQLGHAKATTTLDIYSHIFERQKVKTASIAENKINTLRNQ